jgi:hypothetical protein
MAEHDFCHAAGQLQFEVHEGLRTLPGLDLGLRYRCDDYLDAVNFAAEFLDEHDPAREGLVSALEIVKVSPEGRQLIWRYAYSEAAAMRDPSEVWGFDVTRTWRLPTAGHPQIA